MASNTEAKVQGKEHPRTWGPWEFMHILSKRQERFRAANPLVPLQGLIQNQILPYRPDRRGKLTLVDLSDDETTQAIASGLRIHRLPPSRGISLALADERVRAEAAWKDGSLPVPDWELLNRHEPAKWRKRDHLPSVAVAVEVNLS